MDCEISPFALFTPIDSDAFNKYLGITPTFIGAFASTPENQPDISLSLFRTSLLLKDRLKTFYILELTFQIKLEILYFQNRDVTSQIIGFSLLTQNRESISFFGYDAPQFTLVLGKILNMKGFQEMFRPVRKLGRGNFATVYQAQRKTDKKKFAVKAFSKQNSYCGKNGRQNLINQLSLLRDLNVEPHPNVLRLEAVFQSQNSIYVVLELLEGKTLLETLQEKRNELPTYAQIQHIMKGLTEGVAHLCKNRVMHRDIKPQNIMIRTDNKSPVIVDFGLSTNVDLPEYLFFRCGTPGYVAPEVIRLTHSIHLEPTCDVFSLGCIFHLLLTCRALFPGIKYDQVYRSNKDLKYNFDGEDYQNLNQDALSLMKKMLIIDEKDRITAAEALNHEFFGCNRLNNVQNQIESPEVTATGSSFGDKKKKKKFFFF